MAHDWVRFGVQIPILVHSGKPLKRDRSWHAL